MIQSLYRTGSGRLERDLSPSALATALQDPRGLHWVDLSQEPPESCEPVLRDVFEFHPLCELVKASFRLLNAILGGKRSVGLPAPVVFP
jgi:hypothetical protein